jgi:N-carbamoylputrescine amidase
MKATVCELPGDQGAFAKEWERLVAYVQQGGSEFVLLPEMPFYRWLSHSRDIQTSQWEAAVAAHSAWIDRLDELAPAIVASTRPVTVGGRRLNAGYLWEPEQGVRDVHTKYYLPDEAGFWEASWYERGDGDFSLAHTPIAKVGFLICTELWFNAHARAYGKGGMHLLVCPRATPNPTAPKWVAGGQAAAVVSGAYCLSSNLAGKTKEGGDYAGVGWIIEPGEGRVLGLTSAERPFLTIDLDLGAAERAKGTYPRYVQE